MKSRSFWLVILILAASVVFTAYGVMSGAQWSALAGGLFTAWQGKDVLQKRQELQAERGS